MTMDAQVATVEAGQTPVLDIHAMGPRRFEVRGKLPVGHPAWSRSTRWKSPRRSPAPC